MAKKDKTEQPKVVLGGLHKPLLTFGGDPLKQQGEEEGEVKDLLLGDALLVLLGNYPATGREAVMAMTIGREIYQATKRRMPCSLEAEELVLLRKAVDRNSKGQGLPEGFYRSLVLGQIYEKIGTGKGDIPAPIPEEAESAPE